MDLWDVWTVNFILVSVAYVMAKLNFQQPLLQLSVSRDPSEIILIFGV